MTNFFYYGHRWPFSEAAHLAEQPGTCLYVEKSFVDLLVPASRLASIDIGIKESITNLLNHFCDSLNGILIAYSRLRLHSPNFDLAEYLNDFQEVRVHGTFVIFRPQSGDKLNGVITRVNAHHIGCLVHRNFTASVRAESEIDLQGFYFNGEHMTFQVDRLESYNGISSIRGIVKDDAIWSHHQDGTTAIVPVTVSKVSSGSLEPKKTSSRRTNGPTAESSKRVLASPVVFETASASLLLKEPESLDDTESHSSRKKKKKRRERDQLLASQEVTLGDVDVVPPFASETLVSETGTSAPEGSEAPRKKDKKRRRESSTSAVSVTGSSFAVEVLGASETSYVVEVLGAPDAINTAEPPRKKKKKKSRDAASGEMAEMIPDVPVMIDDMLSDTTRDSVSDSITTKKSKKKSKDVDPDSRYNFALGSSHLVGNSLVNNYGAVSNVAADQVKKRKRNIERDFVG